MKKFRCVLVALTFLPLVCVAQVTTTINPSIEAITQKLRGNNVEITNVSLTCPSGAYALYSNLTGDLSALNSGILLTTGSASNVAGPTVLDYGVENFGPGSILGNNLAGMPTFEACYLKFLITPVCHTLSVNYAFASSEYSDYVGQINDVFGFVLDGPNPAGGSYNQTNIALVPGTNLPVSINTVNNGSIRFPFIGLIGPCTNCAYFIDQPSGIIYNGSTTVLTAKATVVPCQTYTMTIGVWDAADGKFDSGVFLDVNGLSCAGSPTISATTTPSFVCGPQTITLTASGASTSGSYSYSWTAPAPGGLVTSTGGTVTAYPTLPTTYTLNYTDMNLCPGTSLIETTTVDFFDPSFSVSSTPASGTICAGNSATLRANAVATSYSWSPNTGLSSTTHSIVIASPSVTTTYTVTKTLNGCSSSTTVTVYVASTGSLAASATKTLICAGNTGALLTASFATTYTWMPGSMIGSTINVNPTNTTTYTVIGKTNSGCLTYPAVLTVSVLSGFTPSLTASSNSICLPGTVSITTTYTGSGYTYSWSSSGAIQGANNTPSVVAQLSTSGASVFTLTINDGLCTGTNTLAIKVVECTPPVANFMHLTNDSICTTGCVTFSATPSGGEPMTYEWHFIGGTPPISTMMSPEVCYSTPGNYTVALMVSNPWGKDTLIIPNDINVADMPVVVASRDTTIQIGQTVPIHAVGATYYQWYPNDGTIACPTCSSTTVQPKLTTQYIVVGSNSPYCISQDTVNINVEVVCGDFFIPNVFSPNGDGSNDVLTIYGFCVKTYTLQIYNRWGEKVFETSDQKNGWDGSFKGKPMDTGAFMYKVDGITTEEKPFHLKGNITLLR